MKNQSHKVSMPDGGEEWERRVIFCTLVQIRATVGTATRLLKRLQGSSDTLEREQRQACCMTLAHAVPLLRLLQELWGQCQRRVGSLQSERVEREDMFLPPGMDLSITLAGWFRKL